MKRDKLLSKLPKNTPMYVCFIILLALTAIGIVLILAQGLNSSKFFDDIDLKLAAIPFAYAFPVYIVFAYADHMKKSDDHLDFFPLKSDNYPFLIKTTFGVMLLSVLAAITLFITMSAGGNDVEIIATLHSLATFPSLLYFMALTAYSHLKSMRVWKGLAFLFAFIFVSAATTMIFVGIIVYSPKFILLYLTYPLCAIIALMAGRKDDE